METKLLEIEELFVRYRDSLFRYISFHTVNREDAEDLLQDIFFNCCRYYSRFDPARVNEKAWLFVIARNRLKNYYRDRKPSESLDQLVESYGLEIADDFSDQGARLMESREILAKALAQLQPRSREIVVLRYFSGRSIGEIADLMGISPGNVRVILCRALDQMESFLKKNGWEEN